MVFYEQVHMCDTLFMCVVFALNWGMRAGGGIGDSLKPTHELVGALQTLIWLCPHSIRQLLQQGSDVFSMRNLYDLTFFIVLILIVLNLVFGVIIDTFGDLRTEKQVLIGRARLP